MKIVRVVAAIIKSINKNGQPIIFATQRGYGEYKDGWEFPGGKIEEGETLYHVGLDVPERNVSFHVIRGIFIHQFCKDRRPQDNLQRHKDHHKQPHHRYQNIPYDLPRFHPYKSKENLQKKPQILNFVRFLEITIN